MKDIIKNSIILCMITLVSGVLLGLVYEVTKEPRAKQEELTKQKAYQQVFQEAEEFSDVEYDTDALAKYLNENGISSKAAQIDAVVTAKDASGTEIGYVVTVTDKEGYGGDVTLAMGVKNDGTILGISFLTLQETAGLGMRAKEDAFKNQFADKKVESFKVVKNGKQAEDEIDAISSATVTSNAVVNGVNAGILCVEYFRQN